MRFYPFRLYSDAEYLETAARHLGAGVNNLDVNVADNISAGLKTAASAYHFLTSLQ